LPHLSIKNAGDAKEEEYHRQIIAIRAESW
jgi:dephospho-CoA kinase